MDRKHFHKYAADKGLKLTRERDEIVQEVLRTKGHFAADDLYLKLKTGGSKASRASVYRTLPLLVESGLVHEVERIDKHSHYELVSENRHHDHLICTECGRVIEFYSEEIEKMQESICKKMGFRGQRHCLEILGLCSKCC